MMGDAAEVTRASNRATAAAEAIGQEIAVTEAAVTVMPVVVATAGNESFASPSAEDASADHEAPGEVLAGVAMAAVTDAGLGA